MLGYIWRILNIAKEVVMGRILSGDEVRSNAIPDGEKFANALG
jgi:hypothetical protein